MLPGNQRIADRQRVVGDDGQRQAAAVAALPSGDQCLGRFDQRGVNADLQFLPARHLREHAPDRVVNRERGVGGQRARGQSIGGGKRHVGRSARGSPFDFLEFLFDRLDRGVQRIGRGEHCRGGLVAGLGETAFEAVGACHGGGGFELRLQQVDLGAQHDDRFDIVRRVRHLRALLHGEDAVEGERFDVEGRVHRISRVHGAVTESSHRRSWDRPA